MWYNIRELKRKVVDNMKKIISNMFLIGAILFLALLLFSFIDVNLHNNPNSNDYKQYADWNVFTYFIE